MARFAFNLAAVLRQREHAEQAAQRVAAAARQTLVTAQATLHALDAKRRDADAALKQRLVGPINVQFIAGHRRFLLAMEQQALDAARKIAEAQVAVDRAQALLLTAARDRKSLETLRDRQHERWLEAQTRAENADLDEAGMQIAYERLSEAER